MLAHSLYCDSIEQSFMIVVRVAHVLILRFREKLIDESAEIRMLLRFRQSNHK